MSVAYVDDPRVATRTHTTPPESIPVQVTKAAMYIAATTALLWPLATPVGIVSAGVGVALASIFAELAFRRGMRPLAAVVLGAGLATLFGVLSAVVRDTTWIAMALGVAGTIHTSDLLLFGLGLGAALFVVRYLAKKSRPIGIVEIILVAFAVVYMFIDHRNLNLNHPRGFSDFMLEQGWDPVLWLKIFGIAIMVVALLMLLRQAGSGKTALSMILACGVGAVVFLGLKDCRPPSIKEVPTAALAGDGDDKSGKDDDDDGGGGKDGDGKGGGGKDGKGGKGGGQGKGGGKSNNPYDKDFNPQSPPQPVAVVTFHDDFESKEGILYFRQNVLSTFDQSHLSTDASGKWDPDVLSKFPTTEPIIAPPVQNEDSHTRVPTSMYLLADHPQPVALSHAVELRPLENPNPSLFVAAYDVVSDQLSVDYQRLLGRKSVPDSWDAETRKHYLEYPDDPRYLSLSDQIVRDLDPRFQDDDLMKAFAIKRYLEKNGFYTLKETHQSESDPTASFLFGSMRGYCVHFAHSAVFLFRSQGIAARVAVGYGVDTRKRGSGSSMLILGNQAHAWPEIYLDGIGWITFDIYPEQSDQPPEQVVDQDLANMLGEIARKDPSGGMRATPDSAPFPWETILWILAAAIGGVLVSAYWVKGVRRVMPALAPASTTHRWALRAAHDRLADMGLRRGFGESHEGFARRVAALTPSLAPLTMAHLSAALGRPTSAADSRRRARDLYRESGREMRKSVPWHKRLGAFLNPIGWVFSR